jgi:RHS repeat-associated protein
MRLLQEECKGLTTTYLYEQDSYAPLARMDQAEHEKEPRIYYFHCNASGQPEEMTDSDGKLIWRGRYSTFGKVSFESITAHTPRGFTQNLRMQGQYADKEIDLCYNTFRYYDPDIGRFTTEDPIGLLGGINLYQYAPNPLAWIDPWGWAARVPSADFSNNGLFPAGEGQSSAVTIKMQGGRSLDATQAFGKSGISPSEAKGYDWHHMSDFKPKTGEVTMQLVDKNIHGDISHSGGVSQYQKYSGTKYGTPEAKAFAREKGWRSPKFGSCR